MENKKKTHGLRYILGSMGPSIILTATYIGSGSVVSATTAGANFGYSLLWWIAVLSAINGIFQYHVNKYAILTGKPLMVGIRERFGSVWGVIGGVLCIISVLVYGIGNFIASGLAFNIIFPQMSIKVGGVLGTILCIILILFPDIYKKVEHGMSACILLMVVFFIVTFAIVGGADAGDVASGMVPRIPNGAVAIMLSLLGTTVSFGPMIYGSTFAIEKGWEKEDIKKGGLLADAIVGPVAYFVIIGIILILGAKIFPGQSVSSALQIAVGLQTAIGGNSIVVIVFGIAFLGAALSSLLGAQMWGVGMLFQGLGKNFRLDIKSNKYLCIGTLTFCAIIGLTIGGIPTQALLVAQWAGIITTPLLGVLTIIMLRSQKELGDNRASVGTTIVLSALYVLLMAVVVNNFISMI